MSSLNKLDKMNLKLNSLQNILYANNRHWNNSDNQTAFSWAIFEGIDRFEYAIEIANLDERMFKISKV